MAKIRIVGSACVITSARTLEELKRDKKYRPNALKLVEDKKTTFAVDVTEAGYGSASTYGVCFDAATPDKEKLACLTLMIPAGIANPLTYVRETYGAALLGLNTVESALAESMAGIDADDAAINAAIVIG